MKNKEKYIERLSYFKNNETREIFIEQIERYFNLIEKEENKYNIGDEIILDDNYLIHGSRINFNELNIIKDCGIISSEFYSGINVNKKKPWVAEFWKITEKISLKNWIDKYCGVTIEFKNREGDTFKSVISSFENIKQEIIKIDNYRDYIIFQNQEQRFVPNEVVNNSANFAFIINTNTENKRELVKYDIFDEKFNRNILKDILPKWFIEKYIDGQFDNNETGREKAIIFGLPSNMIEGILVSKNIEKDINSLNIIKNIFSNCYICNIEGRVIL